MSANEQSKRVIGMAKHAASLSLPSYVTDSFLGTEILSSLKAKAFNVTDDDFPSMVMSLLTRHETRSLRIAVTKTLKHAPTYEIQSALIGILLIACETGHIRQSDELKLKETLSCPLSPESRRLVNELSSIFTTRILTNAQSTHQG